MTESYIWGQNIWQEVRKSGKTEQNQKTWISTFIFDCYCKNLNYGGESGH